MVQTAQGALALKTFSEPAARRHTSFQRFSILLCQQPPNNSARHPGPHLMEAVIEVLYMGGVWVGVQASGACSGRARSHVSCVMGGCRLHQQAWDAGKTKLKIHRSPANLIGSLQVRFKVPQNGAIPIPVCMCTYIRTCTHIYA